MLNTFPFSSFAVPVPSGVTQLYNTTKTLGGDLIAGDLILTDTTINTAGFRIYCKSLTMNGSTLQNNGSDGSNATGGAGGPLGSVGSGGAGGTFAISTVLPDDLRIASVGGSGGRGGDGSYSSGVAGGVCSFNPPAGDYVGYPYSFNVFTYGYQLSLSSTNVLTPRVVRGGGGGGFGGAPQAGSGNGGGGGGGGGVVLICCSGDISMKQSRIEVVGGNGADGSATAPYISGGGGGGGGGAIIIKCNSLFIHGLSNYGLIARGGVAGRTASPSGAGSYGNIYINTATNAYHYTGGDVGGSDDVALS